MEINVIQPTTKGIIPVYKPLGKSSHWVVNKIRWITGEKRVGHAGTLDPLADGVLVVGIGRQNTKKLGSFLKEEKEYTTEVTLGAYSTTDDSEGEKRIIDVSTIPTLDQIHQVLPHFTGEIWQTPPFYSAVKVNGVRAYKRIREGQDFSIEPRKREVKSIEILSYAWPTLTLKIITGSGVYIRSLARDIGEKLTTGGYIETLTRTRVGDFTLSTCYSLPDYAYKG